VSLGWVDMKDHSSLYDGEPQAVAAVTDRTPLTAQPLDRQWNCWVVIIYPVRNQRTEAPPERRTFKTREEAKVDAEERYRAYSARCLLMRTGA
jgi:hypothetical protein